MGRWRPLVLTHRGPSPGPLEPCAPGEPPCSGGPEQQAGLEGRLHSRCRAVSKGREPGAPVPGAGSALRPVSRAPQSGLFRSPQGNRREREGLPVPVIYGPRPPLFCMRRMKRGGAGGGAHQCLVQEIGNCKPRVCPHPAPRLTRRRTQHPPDLCSLHLWQAGSGHHTEAPQKSSAGPASCATASFRPEPLLCRRPVIFFGGGGRGRGRGSSTKRILKLFFSLNFRPLYSSTQRDRTFGKIILRSTPTCDHNFKSRNLLSSCGENKGPGSDLGAGGGEAARGSEAAGAAG